MKTLKIAMAAIACGMATMAEAAPPKCELTKYLELPVQMQGRRAMVSATINGKPARFILDSGAFYSTMSRASAAEYGLQLEGAPDITMRGINGEASIAVGTTKSFGIGGFSLPHVEFVVGGTDTGSVGLLGGNFLGRFDVEYDLPHGAIRLIGAKNCAGVTPAYWAGDKPITAVALDGTNDPFRMHIVGEVTLNGVRMTAVFDTGATGAIMTTAAAKRAGVTPATPGVTASGTTTGLGSREVKVWTATFKSIDIGGEMIPNPKFEFADMDISGLGSKGADMLIGIDFFLSHRIYVGNKTNKMLFTYEGGPVFGLNAQHARSSDGAIIDTTNKTAAPTDAEGFARRGAVAASNSRADAALADFDQAVTLAPKEPRYLLMRARLRFERGQRAPAIEDLDKAVTLDPADPELRMTRAALMLEAKDSRGIEDDLRAADKALAPSSDKRLGLASLFDEVGAYPAAIANYDAWLKVHVEDAGRPTALNGRCWTRAQANRELDKALDDCNAALRLRPGNPAFLDSRGLVRLRRGELANAKADYDAALAATPKAAWTLYTRSIVRKKMGDAAGAEADRKEAVAIMPAAADRARKLGLEN